MHSCRDLEIKKIGITSPAPRIETPDGEGIPLPSRLVGLGERREFHAQLVEMLCASTKCAQQKHVKTVRIKKRKGKNTIRRVESDHKMWKLSGRSGTVGSYEVGISLSPVFELSGRCGGFNPTVFGSTHKKLSLCYPRGLIPTPRRHSLYILCS